MLQLTKRIFKTISFRMSLLVTCVVGTLLIASVAAVLYYSHHVMRRDSMENANVSLEYTIKHIDNILLSVEHSAGNIYFALLHHLDSPEMMHTFCRKMVETNPYVSGCAIAMEPYYYKDSGQYFMPYYYSTGVDSLGRKHIVRLGSFADSPYTEQEWYTRPMDTGQPCWIDPIKGADDENEVVTTYSLPIYTREGRVVGVLGVDVSAMILSDIVHAAKPTPNAFAVLMGADGSFIVHPESHLLLNQDSILNRYEDTDGSLHAAAKAMLAGESGYRKVFINGTALYVFFRPFSRSVEPGRVTQELKWSIGVLFPEEDIKGSFWRMRTMVIVAAATGLLMLLVLCRVIIHRQLKPLRTLTKSAQHIANGHYEVPIANSPHHDEVGELQNSFSRMQKALSTYISDLQQLTSTLRENNVELQLTYNKAKEADRMKTAVLHNMTDQMTMPVNAISECVEALCASDDGDSAHDIDAMTAEIAKHGKTVTRLLDELLDASQEKPIPMNTE